MSDLDPRLGRKGQFKPQQTLSGQPITGQIPLEVGLPNGFYVIIDPAVGGDWRGELRKLQLMAAEYQAPIAEDEPMPETEDSAPDNMTNRRQRRGR